MSQNDNNDQSSKIHNGAFSSASADKQAGNITGASTDAFYITGGNVPADALSYVTRDADARLLQHLLHGDFCYILTSRQMGKSSLMTHMVKRLREHHVAPAVLDLSSQGFSLTAEQWYNGLLEQLGRRLKIEDEIEDFCHDHSHLSPLQLWQSALRHVVLEVLTEPVVIFIDEIDVVRSLTFSTDEFFAAIRACYNARTEDPAFARLSFCLLGVATPADLIANPRLTPFNIGTRIELSDFSREEANGLSHGLGPNAETNRVLLDRIYYWTGGHPYLTQRLCQAVAENDANLTERSVDICAERLFLSSKAQRQDSNLMFVQQRMLPNEEEQRVGLLTLYARVLSGKSVVADSETGAYVSVLKLAGIVAAVGGQLRVRNRIYAQVFGKGWIEENMPGAELRRLREAYRKGMVRVGTVASAIVGVMGLLTLWAIHAQQQANHFRVKAETQSTIAQQQRQAAERIAYIANMNLIPISYEKNDFKTIARLLEETRTNEFRGFEWGYWNRLAHLDLLTLKDAGIAAFSPDGKCIVTAVWGDKAVKIRDATTGDALCTFKSQFGISKVAFSPDGKHIITTDANDKTAQIWDAITGRAILKLRGHTDEVLFEVITPDGTGVVTIARDKTAKIRDVATGQELVTLKGRMSNIRSVAFSPDGKQIVIGKGDKTVKTWDVRTGRELISIEKNEDQVNSATFSPNGKLILTYGSGNNIKVWDASTGREVFTLKGHPSSIFSAVFSPDGTRIAATSKDKIARVWDTATGHELVALQGHSKGIYAIAFSPNGQQIVTGSYDATARVWDAHTGQEILTLRGHNDSVDMVAFSPDGKRILTCSSGETKIWNAAAGSSEALATEAQNANIASLSFSPDGGRIVTSLWDNTVKVWDTSTGRALPIPLGHSDGVSFTTFSPDGRRIVTGSPKGNITFWNALTGHEELSWKGHTARVVSMAFSQDGRHLFTGSWDETAKVWDAATGRKELTLKGFRQLHPAETTGQMRMTVDGNVEFHSESIASAAFSPDGKHIITGSYNTFASVWDAETGKELLAINGQASDIYSVAFSPDGRRMVTGDSGGTVKVWDAKSGREMLTLWGHHEAVFSVAFSPDNKRIVTGGMDGTVRVWDAATGRETLTLQSPGPFSGVVTVVAFSPDGRRIAAAKGHRVTIWYSDSNDWKEMMRDTNEANAQTLQDTQQAQSHLSRAEALVKANNYAQAVTEYKAALQVRPTLGNAAFLGNLGWYEYLAGRIDDAIKSSRSALEKDATLAFVRMNLGLCYATQNDWPRAKQEYDLALKTAPKASLKAGIEDVQTAIKKHATRVLSQALAYLQKAAGK